MKWLSFTVPVLWLALAAPSSGQAPQTDRKQSPPPIVAGDVSPTPEMWFYQEYQRQYQDPKLAVRQAAEYRANQRMSRIAAREWYGFSNLRPQAATDPIHGDDSPRWTGRSHLYPSRWTGSAAPLVVIRPESRTAY